MTDCPGGGVQRFIRIAKQVDFETEGTTFRYCGLAQNADDTISQENIKVEGIENVNAVTNIAGTRQSTTSVEFDYQVGRVFELAFNTPSHAQSTDDWTHTFTATNVPPYLTVVVGSDAVSTNASKHTGHIVDSFNISYELNGTIKVGVSTVGNYEEGITTKPSHTVPTTSVLYYRNATFNINSVEVTKVQSASINVTHAVEPVHGTSDVDMVCNIFLGREVEFTVNAALNTQTYRTHIKNQDVTAVALAVNNGITLGSGRRGFDMALNNIVVTSLEETGAVGSITTFTMSGTAVVNTLTAVDGISSSDW